MAGLADVLLVVARWEAEGDAAAAPETGKAHNSTEDPSDESFSLSDHGHTSGVAVRAGHLAGDGQNNGHDLLDNGDLLGGLLEFV